MISNPDPIPEPDKEPASAHQDQPEAFIYQFGDGVTLPPASLAQAAQYYRDLAPSDTHDDRLCAIFAPSRAVLNPEEKENYDVLSEALVGVTFTSCYGKKKGGEEFSLSIDIIRGGPFRSWKDGGSVYAWTEVVDTRTGQSLVPDLRLLRRFSFDEEIGMYRPERFSSDRVRILHTMVREGEGPNGITHRIDPLFNMQTAFEAISHFLKTAHEAYGQVRGHRYSIVRELCDRELDAYLRSKILAHYGKLRKADELDLVQCLRSEGCLRIIEASSSMNTDGEIFLTALVRMPRPDFDLQKPQHFEAVTFQLSLDPLGRLKVYRVGTKDCGVAAAA